MKRLSIHVKIFIGLALGILLGMILNLIGGESNAFISNTVLPLLQFVGDLFVRLIRMIVVPLVFFSIMDAVNSLQDIRQLKSIGFKTIISTF